MATVTGNTKWKETGDTNAEALRTEFATRGIAGRTSPLINHAADIQRAASPYTRLLAAMSWVEQKHGTFTESPIPANFHNFMSMAQGWDPAINGHTWYRFDNHADCAAFWKARLESATGPYPQDGTIRDLINVYAPPGPPDFNQTEEYVQDVVEIINRLPDAGPVAGATETISFGNVPNPGIQVRIIEKPEGKGWNDRGQRDIVAVCVHRMLGTLRGTEDFFSDPAGDGYDSLTDFGIGGLKDPGLDGAIYQWNGLRGVRRPWANGWGDFEDPLVVSENHGRDFVTRWMPMGYDVNRDIASIELSGCTAEIVDGSTAFWCGADETEVTPAQFEALAALIAYIADQYCRISYKDFPFNPRVHPEFYAVYQHYEFAGKNCPFPAVKALHESYVARAKEIMQHHQTQAAAAFTPFAAPRTFHVRLNARATARREPSLGSPWVKDYGPGAVVESDGLYQGAAVEGERRWLRTADPQHLAIHLSAIAEPV